MLQGVAAKVGPQGSTHTNRGFGFSSALSSDSSKESMRSQIVSDGTRVLRSRRMLVDFDLRS